MPGRNTLPRNLRLIRPSEFRSVFKRGGKAVGACFVCYLAPRDDQGSKLGLAVSQKVGSAVVRNRVKRYVREFFRTHRHAFRRPVAMVVVARPPAARLDAAQTAQALERLLRKGGLLDG